MLIGYRDSQVWPLYGQYKWMVPLAGAFFPTACGHLVSASIGIDNLPGYGVTGTIPFAPFSTTLSVQANPGDTSVTVTDASGFSVLDYVQLDVNAPTGSPVTTSEVRQITHIAGDVLTLESAAPLVYTHLVGAAAQLVISPFTHTMYSGLTLGSMTVQKRPGDTQAIQYQGTRINKFSLKAQATNSAVTYTADGQARNGTIIDSPPDLPVVDEPPFIFAGVTVARESLDLVQAKDMTVDIDNKVVADWTLNQSHNLEYLTPAGLIVNGSMTVVYDSLDDPDWGFLLQDLNGTQAPVSLTFEGVNETSLVLNFPETNLGVWKDDLKFGSIIYETLNWHASLDLEGTPQPSTMNATLTNQDHLPF